MIIVLLLKCTISKIRNKICHIRGAGPGSHAEEKISYVKTVSDFLEHLLLLVGYSQCPLSYQRSHSLSHLVMT